MSSIVTRRKAGAAADADVSMETGEDGSETRSLRRRSAAATTGGTTYTGDGTRRKSSAASDDKDNTPSEQKGMKTRTRTSVGTPPTTPVSKSTRTMVTRERKESPVVDEGGIIYKSRLVSSRKRSLTDKDNEPVPADGLSSPPKKRRTIKLTENGQEEKDYYCWLCHKEGDSMISCELCPRAFHSKCLGIVPASEDWVCPECEKIMRAECVDTQSKAMMKLSLDQLCMVLNFAVARLKHTGSKPFQKAVDPSQVPSYKDYIVHPMDIDQIEKNIKQKLYGSTEAFLADVKWILHNCIIFNGVGGKLTAAAKLIVKIAKHETSEVEICPECYLNSYLKKNNNWFCEPCKPPHTLIWAKLKGYPFWPAKALREVGGQVDVRFFGAHDRSWVPVSQVYLLSKEPPVPVKMKKWGFDESMDELQTHINRIKNKFGAFHYSAFRVPYDPKDPYSPEKYRPGKIEIDESPSGAASAKGKTALKSPPGAVKKFFSKTPLAKRTFKQAIMMKNATKAASSLKNKYSSLASNRRARLSKNTSAESDKSEGENMPKSETDDDTPIGDQLDSLFGKTEDSDAKEEVEEKDERESENIVIKSKPDPVHESDPDEEISSMAQVAKDSSSCDLKEVSDSEKTGAPKGSEKTVDEDITNTELTLDPAVSKTDVPKTMLPGKNSIEDTKDNEGGKTEGRDITTEKVPQDIVQNTEVRDSNNISDINNENSKLKESDHVDSSVDDSLDGDKSYNTESDSDLAALRSFSMAVNEANNTESSTVCSVDVPNRETSTATDEKATSKHVTKLPLNNNSIVKDHAETAKDNDKSNESSAKGSDEQHRLTAVGGTMASTSDIRIQSPGTSLESGKSPKGKESCSSEETTAGVSATTSGTPKKNPFLENLVESCKAKLGVNEEQLKSDMDDDDDDAEDEKEDSEEDDEAEDESASESVGSDAGTTTDDDGKDSLGRESPMEVDKKKNSGKVSKRRRSASDILQDLLKKSVETVKARRSSNVSGESSVSSKSSEKTSEVGSAKRKQPKTKIQDIREKKKLEKEWRERQLQRKREQYEEAQKKEGAVAVTDFTEVPGENGKTPATERTESLAEMETPNLANLIKPIDVDSSPSPPQIEKAVDTTSGQITKDTSPEKTMPALQASGKESEREKIRASFVEQMVESATGSFAFEKYMEKAMSSVKNVMVDMYKDVVSTEANKAVSRHLQLELERMQWRHQQELQEMKHNFELVLSEQRMLLEHERQQQIENLKKSFMKEREEIIKETKKKQWCANCGKEAMFYCCWNTSYCDYPCQQSHWPKHMSTCTQNSANVSSGVGAGGGQESSEADSTVNEQNAIWQNAARQLKRQEMERPSSMGQASGPSPVHFMQGSPQMMSGSFNPMSSQPPIRMHNIATYQTTPQQMRFGGQNILQPSPMMQQNSQPIVYSLVRPPNMQNQQQPVLISRPGMQGQVIRNPFGYQPGPPSY